MLCSKVEVSRRLKSMKPQDGMQPSLVNVRNDRLNLLRVAILYRYRTGARVRPMDLVRQRSKDLHRTDTLIMALHDKSSEMRMERLCSGLGARARLRIGENAEIRRLTKWGLAELQFWNSGKRR